MSQVKNAPAHSYNIGSLRALAVNAMLSAGVSMVLMLMLMLSVCTCSTAASQKQQIRSVEVSDQPESFDISIDAALPISLVTSKANARSVAFDVRGLYLGMRKSEDIHSCGVKNISYGILSLNPAVTRIVYRCYADARPYTVKYSDGNRHAVISIAKTGFDTVKSAKVAAENDSAVRCLLSSSISSIDEFSVSGAAHAMVDHPIALPALSDLGQQKVAVASANPAIVPIFEAKALVAESRQYSNKISLDFVGSDIHDVLKALALQSGVNIVAGSEVKGQVTVSLNNIGIEDALKLVTGMCGYKFAKVNGTYVVGTAANLQAVSAENVDSGKSDGKSAAVVQIKYGDVNSIVTLLAKEYPNVKTVVDRDSQYRPGESASPEMRLIPHGSTMLVLEGTADDVNAAKTVAEQIEACLGTSIKDMIIDTYEVRFANSHDMRQAVMNYIPGVRVMEAPGSYDFNKIGTKMNSQLKSSFSTTGGVSNFGMTVPVESATTAASASTSTKDVDAKDESKSTPSLMNVLVIQGSPEDVKRAKELLIKLDIPENQIVLEAKILDMSEDMSKDLGIDWSWSSFTIGETKTKIIDSNSVTNTTLGKFNRSPAQINATVNALITQGKGKVLATPNICIQDGKQGNIFIGDEVTYVSSSGTTTQGAQLITTATIDVGVGLIALCRVSTDGYITMSLRPEVSTITSWLDVSGGGKIPQIATRKVTSTVRVKDGETIVIGGLLRDTDIDNISKVPILSDLPFFGGLFKNRTKTKNHSEVMMFITPRVLKSN